MTEISGYFHEAPPWWVIVILSVMLASIIKRVEAGTYKLIRIAARAARQLNAKYERRWDEKIALARTDQRAFIALCASSNRLYVMVAVWFVLAGFTISLERTFGSWLLLLTAVALGLVNLFLAESERDAVAESLRRQ